jgi:hypothetical protein
MKEKFNCRGGHEPAGKSLPRVSPPLLGTHRCSRRSWGPWVPHLFPGADASRHWRWRCRLRARRAMAHAWFAAQASSAGAGAGDRRHMGAESSRRRRGGVAAAGTEASRRRARSRRGGREGTSGGGRGVVTAGARALTAAGAEASRRARGHRRRRARRHHGGREGTDGGCLTRALGDRAHPHRRHHRYGMRRGEGGRARGGRGRVRTDDDDNISFLLAVGFFTSQFIGQVGQAASGPTCHWSPTSTDTSPIALWPRGLRFIRLVCVHLSSTLSARALQSPPLAFPFSLRLGWGSTRRKQGTVRALRFCFFTFPQSAALIFWLRISSRHALHISVVWFFLRVPLWCLFLLMYWHTAKDPCNFDFMAP